MLHSICQQIWKLSGGHRTGKGQFSFQSQRKVIKDCSNYCTTAHISQANKVMFKILQARLQQYMNWEPSDAQAGFGNQRLNCQHSLNCGESKGIPEKTSTSASLTTLKLLTVWITANCGKLLKKWEYQTTLPASWKTCIWIKKQQLKPTWNNRLDPNWERNTSRLYIVTLFI